jgi:aspartate/tyrosine/aromatic aminotransferase
MKRFEKILLYLDERVGNLTVVTNNSQLLPKLRSQFTTVVRANYSNPPAHGARVAAAILNNKALNDEWLINLSL